MAIMNSKQRQTNYELLRFLAIILISLMHGIRSAYGSPNLLNSISFVSVNALGNMGVTVFILISGYFSITLKASKLFKLWSIVLFYSLLIFVYNILINNPDPTYDFISKTFIKEIYKALTPITSGTWWFFTSYTILFMLSPLLNSATKNMSKEQFKYLIAVLLIFYSLSPTFLMHSLSNTPNGKCTENMILAYLIGRYLSIYGIPKTIKNHTSMMLGACLLLIFIINFFVFDPLFMAKDHNLFIILGAICIFSIFSDIKIAASKPSSIIGNLASFAFPIYLMNIFLIDILEFQYAELRSENTYLLFYLLVQTEIIIISILTEHIRRLIFDKPMALIGAIVDKKTEKITSSIK